MAIDEATARERLLAERRRLEALRGGQPGGHLEESEQDSSAELSSFDQHPGDMATETFDRERDQSLVERVEASLKDVDDALRRLDEGVYGICEGTGERISDERLEALPAARYTLEYEQRLERERGVGEPVGGEAAPGAPGGEQSPREEPSADGTTAQPDEALRNIDEATFATYNVTAAFPGMESARGAIESLERTGVAGSRISLLGKQAEEAAEVRDTAQRDEATIEEGMRATIGGAAAGTGIGAAAGFVAGAAVFGIPGIGPAVGAGIWALTLGGAAAGGGVGFTAGAMANMKQSQAWELTLQEVSDGLVVVGVHTHDRDEFSSAVEALRGAEPTRMHQFDNAGNELHSEQGADGGSEGP